MRRRPFLGVLSGVTLPTLGLADPPTGGRIGPNKVDALYRHTARLRRLDNILGGADTYQLYAAQAAVTEHLLTNARYTEHVGQRLGCLLAEQYQLAGWAAFDTGHHTQAHRHYTTSLTVAEKPTTRCWPATPSPSSPTNRP